MGSPTGLALVWRPHQDAQGGCCARFLEHVSDCLLAGFPRRGCRVTGSGRVIQVGGGQAVTVGARPTWVPARGPGLFPAAVDLRLAGFVRNAVTVSAGL